MGGHEARAFMKWAAGVSPSSTIRKNKDHGGAHGERHSEYPGSMHSSKHSPSAYEQPGYAPSRHTSSQHTSSKRHGSSKHHTSSKHKGPEYDSDGYTIIYPSDSISQVGSRR
ncbi:hypothetical protein F5Y01DRAFT_327007 [Xylaria sp. FL0043]|nr:hypothetical protein F5Y01DRAFT_327007 [Xylaria sp. FL0043]